MDQAQSLALVLGRVISTVFGQDEGDPEKYKSNTEMYHACENALASYRGEVLPYPPKAPGSRGILAFAAKIKSKSLRTILETLASHMPNMTIPSANDGEVFYWGGKLSMYKDYLDFPVYRQYVHGDWIKIEESEFIRLLKIQENL